MKKLQIETTITLFNEVQELPKSIQQLMHRAVEAREMAYAPYSKFKVGAAVLLDNDIVTIGNNQENAAYPSGLCAERVAVFQAKAVYPDRKIKAIAICAASPSQELKEPISPCGSCRQAIAEYENNQQSPIEIYFMGETGSIAKANSIADLLPFMFTSDYL